MIQKHELRYGLKDGEYYSVEDVPKGKKCGCVCPTCKQPLVARKGDERTHHFSHAPGTQSCSNPAETHLHMWAKEILYRTKKLTFPPYTNEPGTTRSRSFEKAELECVLSNRLRADVLLSNPGKTPINVEILVSHKVDYNKRKRLKEIEQWTVEVDLSDLVDTYDEKQILNAFESGEHTKWIYNDSIKADIEKEHLHTIQSQLCDHIDFYDTNWCPRKGHYYRRNDIEEKCSDCNYYYRDLTTEHLLACGYRFKNIKLAGIESVREDVTVENGRRTTIEFDRDGKTEKWVGQALEVLQPEESYRPHIVGKKLSDIWQTDFYRAYVQNVYAPNEIRAVNFDKYSQSYYIKAKYVTETQKGVFIPHGDAYAISDAEKPIWQLLKSETLTSFQLQQREQAIKQQTLQQQEREKRQQKLLEQQKKEQAEKQRRYEEKMQLKQEVIDQQRKEEAEHLAWGRRTVAEYLERQEREAKEEINQRKKEAEIEKEAKLKNARLRFEDGGEDAIWDSDGTRWLKCTICGAIKPSSEFAMYGGSDGDRYGQCEDCK